MCWKKVDTFRLASLNRTEQNQNILKILNSKATKACTAIVVD